MEFWIFAALLTVLALLSIGYPLFWKKSVAVDGNTYDNSVYREQLDEIDRDVERGQIGGAEAELARNEIARRLIALDQSASKNIGSKNRSTATLVTAICSMVLVPVMAVTAYMALGSPQRPDVPLQARLSADPKTQSIEELIARAEMRVKREPDKVQGWAVLAPVYMRINRPKDAITAYRNIIRLGGGGAKTRASLGEAMSIVAGGVITAEAKQHFLAALKADPDNVKTRFFLAIALGQENKYSQAVVAWETLIAKSQANAPWVKPAEQEMQRMRKLAGMDPKVIPDKLAGRPLGNPTQKDIANAASMSAGDRTAMIEGMVANLAEKLAEDPSNIEGWLRLIRSYGVLGRRDDAIAAFTKASVQFADNQPASKKLKEIASAMKIEAKSK